MWPGDEDELSGRDCGVVAKHGNPCFIFFSLIALLIYMLCRDCQCDMVAPRTDWARAAELSVSHAQDPLMGPRLRPEKTFC